MNRFIPLIGVAVTSCALTPAQTMTTIAAAQTLASVAATQNTTVASLLAKGALVCGLVNSVSGQMIEASAEIIANEAGVPVSVVGMTAAAVAAACPPGTVPGPLPVGVAATAVPVVPTASTLPPVT